MARPGYGSVTTYVTSSGAINTWDFSHDGKAVPDTIPDLGAALAWRSAMCCSFQVRAFEMRAPLISTVIWNSPRLPRAISTGNVAPAAFFNAP